MVVAIGGVIIKKEPTSVIIKCTSGLSYGVFISLFRAVELETHQKYELFITQAIKEDSNKFYDFLDKDEQKVFEVSLKVNGAGASTAMAICSSLDVNSFYKTLNLGDKGVLKKAPGIGPKSARHIIVKLEDARVQLKSVSDNKSEALAALLSLGLRQDKTLSVLNTCNGKDTSELIEEALKKLA